jgi:DNA helicase II / ATP-dependent DNA helicase PcrA
MPSHTPTDADHAIRGCIEARRSFALIAGAGSGKTTSLITALELVRSIAGKTLRQNGQRIACITYTNRAVEVIRSRLGFDELYHVATLHSFLWGEIGQFQRDLREALRNATIPHLIHRAKTRDTGKDTKDARAAREQIQRLSEELARVGDVPELRYADSAFSDYSIGRLSHDDVISISAYLMSERANLRRLLGLRYPYILVDEAQDTFVEIVAGLNQVAGQNDLPVIGYFGDPWQQIYDKRAGDFSPPPGGETVTKVENFRSAREVVDFLNAFRPDIRQIPAGTNGTRAGSVLLRVVQTEKPGGERNSYTEAQLQAALRAMDSAVAAWGWEGRGDVVRLFLARQMIARRLGFLALNQLFTGRFASARAQDDFEAGRHYLVHPFKETLCPLLEAQVSGDSRKTIEILQANCPAFSTTGPNASRKLADMVVLANDHLLSLADLWLSDTVRAVLSYCYEHELLWVSDRLRHDLLREPREAYDETLNSDEKGDWLADEFFQMKTAELQAYCGFVSNNSAYSTQHGVKGEEYSDVIVVFDDVEAAWNKYSFAKLLTPNAVGQPTEGQLDRSRKLAYVCFSRATENLRILLFTQDAEASRREVLERGLLRDRQVEIAHLP